MCSPTSSSELALRFVEHQLSSSVVACEGNPNENTATPLQTNFFTRKKEQPIDTTKSPSQTSVVDCPFGHCCPNRTGGAIAGRRGGVSAVLEKLGSFLGYNSLDKSFTTSKHGSNDENIYQEGCPKTCEPRTCDAGGKGSSHTLVWGNQQTSLSYAKSVKGTDSTARDVSPESLDRPASDADKTSLSESTSQKKLNDNEAEEASRAGLHYSNPFRALCQGYDNPPLNQTEMSYSAYSCLPVGYTNERDCQGSNYGQLPAAPSWVYPGQSGSYDYYGSNYQGQYPNWGGQYQYPGYGYPQQSQDAPPYDLPSDYSNKKCPIPMVLPTKESSILDDCDSNPKESMTTKCPPGCISLEDCKKERKNQEASDYNCEEGEEKLKECFAKFDAELRVQSVANCSDPQEFCGKFDTQTSGKCPSFEKAAADKCPELAKRAKTTEEKLRLLQDGQPQCQLKCFDVGKKELDQKSVDWLHQNTCDCPLCSISRILQNDAPADACENDDEECVPGCCCECGAMLDENGCPIEEEEDEEEDEEVDPCRKDDPKNKCYSKKFDYDDRGYPKWEGLICTERTMNFLWQDNIYDKKENSFKRYAEIADADRKPSQTSPLDEPYQGPGDIDRTIRYLWGRPQTLPPEEKPSHKCHKEKVTKKKSARC